MVLEEISQSAMVIGLQEVHDTAEMFNVFTHGFAKAFQVVYSQCDNCAAGGVVLLLRSSLVTCAVTEFSALIPGRVTRVSLTYADRAQLVFWNVHNYNINPRSDIFNTINDDIVRSSDDPANFTMFMVGDFNYIPRGEGRHFAARPGGRLDIDSQAMAMEGAWPRVLDRLIELAQPEPTHISPSNMSLARLDRVYTSAPAWLVSNLHLSGLLSNTPQNLYQRGISDHSPVVIKLSEHQRRHPDQQLIPHHIAKSHIFQEVLAKLEIDNGLEHLDTVRRWQLHKKLVRKAGKVARRIILSKEATSSFSVAQVLTTISRILVRNDYRLAETLISSSLVTRQHIFVESGQVFLKEAQAFATAIDEAKFSLLKNDADRMSESFAGHVSSASSGSIQKKKRALVAIRRQCQLWAPLRKTRSISGIRVPAVYDMPLQILRGSEEMAAGLAAAWAPIFAPKFSRDMSAQFMLDNFSNDYSESGPVSPTVDDMQHVASHARSSATGKDGIPYIAWQGASAATTPTSCCCFACLWLAYA